MKIVWISHRSGLGARFDPGAARTLRLVAGSRASSSPTGRRRGRSWREEPRLRGRARIVRDGETGLLYPPGDAEALAARIAELAGGGALLARLAAQAWVHAAFTRERLAASLESALAEAAG